METMIALGDAREAARRVAPMIPATVQGSAPYPTFQAALDRYVRDVTPSKRGAAQEARRARLLRITWLAPRPLNEIRGVDLARYRDERQGMVGPNTVRLELALVSHLYEIARREWGHEDLQNPAKAIRKPKLPGGRTRRVTLAELEALRSKCYPKLWDIISLALETAMRRGEIAGLTWDRVDLTRRVLRLDETKNGEVRAVPLSSRALVILRAMREKAPDAQGFVFGLETADAITKAFNRACLAAGIEGLRFHDLRHEGVSRLFELGLSLPEVAAISGHKTWAMLRRYTHLSAEALADKLG